MVGRAGRAGFGEAGDSVMICAPRDNQRVMELLCSRMDDVVSHMYADGAKALRTLFVSAIGLGLATCRKELTELTAATLLAVQAERLELDVDQVTKEVLKDLVINQAVTVKQDGQVANQPSNIENVEWISQDGSFLSNTCQNQEPSSSKITKRPKNNIKIKPSTPLAISKLGRASFKSGIDLEKAETLVKDLFKAQQNLVLVNYLHLLHLVIPYDACNIQVYPDRKIFYAKVSAIEREITISFVQFISSNMLFIVLNSTRSCRNGNCTQPA